MHMSRESRKQASIVQVVPVLYRREGFLVSHHSAPMKPSIERIFMIELNNIAIIKFKIFMQKFALNSDN